MRSPPRATNPDQQAVVKVLPGIIILTIDDPGGSRAGHEKAC